MDPRFRICTKMSWIRITDLLYIFFNSVYLAGLEVRPLKDDNEPLLGLLGRTRCLPLLGQLQLSLRRSLSLLAHHMCVRARRPLKMCVCAPASENVRARSPSSKNVRARWSLKMSHS